MVPKRLISTNVATNPKNKPMLGCAHYLILDAYPDPRNKEAQQFLGATIGCWLKMDFATSEEDAEAIARDKLKGLWVVSDVVDYQIVDENCYQADNNDGIDFFRQCLVDGFVANIHHYPRETVSVGNSHDETQLNLLQTAALLNDQGCVSLYSTLDKQWANGVTPEGVDFIPLWVGSDPPSPWLDYWPDYESYKITANELIALLPSFQTIDCWVGLGTSFSSLVMVHPLALKDALGGAEPVGRNK